MKMKAFIMWKHKQLTQQAALKKIVATVTILMLLVMWLGTSIICARYNQGLIKGMG